MKSSQLLLLSTIICKSYGFCFTSSGLNFFKSRVRMSTNDLDEVGPKILRYGDPNLYKVSTPYNLPEEMPLVLQALGLMNKALKDKGGIGIAAPQIGILRRIIMISVPADRNIPEGKEIPLTVMINPSYRPLTDEQNLDWEGCLSVPGMMGQVSRYTHIEYEYEDVDGIFHVVEASNYHARVVQHELDHLNGILYPLRIKDMRKFGFRVEIISSPSYLESKKSN